MFLEPGRGFIGNLFHKLSNVCTCQKPLAEHEKTYNLSERKWTW